jgi:tetratricopeptide (TPR) repeat protein
MRRLRITPFFILLCAYLLIAVALLRIPLLNTLGYEFSALMGIVVGIGGGLFTLALFRKKFSNVSRIAPDVYGRFLLDAVGLNTLALLVPVTVMMINAFFVKNCSILQGLVFVFLIPCITLMFSVALAGLTGLFVSHAKTLYCSIVAVLLLSPLVHMFFEPQLYAYNVFFGFFPGFSYDELLLITQKFILFRILTLCTALILGTYGIVIVSATVPRESMWQKLRTVRFLFRKPRLAFTIVPMMFVLLGCYYFRHELSFETSASSIQKTLGGKYSTEHFDIYYSPSTYPGDDIKRIAGEHEFYYMQIISDLRITPLAKIQSYIYPTPEVKQQLLGTATTDISKPWMREIHVTANSLDGTLKHELVHVIAGRFGMPFFRVSPRMGLIEGLAMALDGNKGERTLHYYAAAMKEFGIDYDINQLLSYSGFMMQAPARSYLVCGSFVQYLLDHYGIERFRRTYQTGSFESGYGRSLQSLTGDWKEYLLHITISDADEAHVRYRFRRPPMFQKTCARVSAEWMNDAGTAYTQKNYTAAAILYRHAYDETGSEDAVLGYLQSEFRRGEYDSVTVSSPARYRPPLMPMADLLAGDAWMMKGDSVRASRYYTELLESNILRSYSELAAIRLTWLARLKQSFVMRQFYRLDDDTLRIDVLTRILLMPGMDAQTQSLYRYLLLRLYVNMQRYSDALSTITGEENVFAYPVLNYSDQVLRATVYERLREWEKAKLHYWRALNYTPQEAAKSWIEDKIELCNWFERHKDF